jgi:2-polyprenyl-3-methyl-5-hydroxy-6-metoxy-1,4-benzoquinol methylase
VSTFVDDVEELSNVATGSVDFVISSQVIEHVDDARTLTALARVTAKGGIVYLSTVQKAWYGWYFHRSEAGWVLDPTHRREYRSDDELLRHVDATKFAVRDNVKSPVAYPIADFLLHRMNRTPLLRGRGQWLSRMRNVRVRIPGYAVWELVLERR